MMPALYVLHHSCAGGTPERHRQTSPPRLDPRLRGDDDVCGCHCWLVQQCARVLGACGSDQVFRSGILDFAHRHNLCEPGLSTTLIAACLVGVALFMLWPSAAIAQPSRGLSSPPQWIDPDRDAPLRSQYHIFHSDVLDKEVSCLVWLPVAYNRAPNRRFPVIYWLHGANGDQRKCARRSCRPMWRRSKAGPHPRRLWWPSMEFPAASMGMRSTVAARWKV